MQKSEDMHKVIFSFIARYRLKLFLILQVIFRYSSVYIFFIGDFYDFLSILD